MMTSGKHLSVKRFNTNILIGLFLSAIGGLACFLTLGMDTVSSDSHGAQIFPLIGSLLVLVFGLVEIIRAVRGNDSSVRLSNRPVIIFNLLLLCGTYLWGIHYFGYVLATAIAAPLIFWLFGNRTPLTLLAASFVIPFVFHLLFFELLGVFPPYGQWFDFLDLLGGR